MTIVLRGNGSEKNGNLLQMCWKELSNLITQPDSHVDLAHLSSDLIKNVISLVNKVNGSQLDGENNQVTTLKVHI
jgi:hypothetical protein